MPAYVINDMDVTDPALLEEYKKLSPSTVALYGGRFIARGGHSETLEGEWNPKRLVILEFPSVDQAKAWIDSPEYAPARAAPAGIAFEHGRRRRRPVTGKGEVI